MSDFGDADPEDAYDAGDNDHERLNVLVEVVSVLEDMDQHESTRTFRILDALRLLDTIRRNRHQVDELRERLELLH